MLRQARGTAPAVDALEIFELERKAARLSLADGNRREDWRRAAACSAGGFDTARSFFLLGRLRVLVDGAAAGQRLFWFGRGLAQMTEQAFVEHYTARHGPLVAGHAPLLGIGRYRQVADEESTLRGPLMELGLGLASPPPVFAEMAVGVPPLGFSSLRQRRTVTRAIRADEQRHIDFARSMLWLA